ncbi:MAG: oligosaccharide flippase family protein [bacterium]|nr:oligosaccharide flippase family protein [bacterium]
MDEVPEVDLTTVKGRAVKGVVALTGRYAILQVVSLAGFAFLSYFLSVSEVGLFVAVSGIVGILGYFSDIGLAAALIQKREQPDIADVRSTFTIQQILVVTLVILVFLLTPFLKSFYSISDNGVWLLWALTIGFFLASLKTIPSVLLERHLRFDLLVIVEVAETLVFYGLAVFFAWKGFGVLSYAWAVMARGIIGAILIYIVSPWQVGFALRIDSLKHLLRFGLPYQGNTFLAVAKDQVMNLVLWKIIGASGVGIIGWAQNWAQKPLRLTMDPVMKVTFPAFSRMQEDKAELKKGIEKTLYFVSLLTFPTLAGMVLLAKPLIESIPRYQKWEVALFALSFYAINSAWASVTTPLTNALSAVGKIKVVFKLMIMWTGLTWLFYPLLAFKYGYNGVAMAAALVATSSFIAIIIARKYLEFNFLSAVKNPFLATLGMSLLIFILKPFFTGIIGVVFVGIIGALSYLALIWFLVGEELFVDFRRFKNSFNVNQ